MSRPAQYEPDRILNFLRRENLAPTRQPRFLSRSQTQRRKHPACESPASRPPSRLNNASPTRLSFRTRAGPENQLKRVVSRGAILTVILIRSRFRSSRASMHSFPAPQRGAISLVKTDSGPAEVSTERPSLRTVRARSGPRVRLAAFPAPT